MKKIVSLILACCVILSLCVSAFADESSSSEDATFDFTEEQEKIEELGIPTVESVDKLKVEADDLWNKKEYADAAIAYATYAKKANWLANIISSGLEPYYSADYDDRKSFSISSFHNNYEYSLFTAESTSNHYKSERNRAMLYEGLCYYNLGEYEEALPLLIKALDLIEISETSYWKLGMSALYSIIGF